MEKSEPILKVRIRGGFSDRNGISKENTQIQYKEFDTRTKNAIKNEISKWLGRIKYWKGDSGLQELFKETLRIVYAEFIDQNCYIKYEKFFMIVDSTIEDGSYDETLSFIEFFVNYLKRDRNSEIINMVARENAYYKSDGSYICICFNNIFKQEYVGYRLVNNIIVQITDENEIESIEKASNTEYDSVNEHLQKAIRLISNREQPDYENSIKESISAVEAMCVVIIGKRGTLGDALKHLEDKGVSIHPSLKAAFLKLFGYTSDAKGIRHAGDIGGASSTFEEAKFMLVSCSAFVNYLTGLCAT